MPILFLSQESPNLAIVDWYLIATEEVSIRADVIEITRMRQRFVRDESARDGNVVRLLFMLLCVRISERKRQTKEIQWT